MKIVRSLALERRAHHVRDLASKHSLSPAGTMDILRRLKAQGVLKDKKVGNKRYVSLILSPEEKTCLLALFRLTEFTALEQRAKKFSKNAKEKLEWMDEAFEFYKGIKSRDDNAP